MLLVLLLEYDCRNEDHLQIAHPQFFVLGAIVISLIPGSGTHAKQYQ